MAVVIGTSSFLLFLSLMVNILAFLVPYWVQDSGILGLGAKSYGLWGSCRCRWFYQDFEDVQESKLEDWYQATQWLYAVAVALMAISLITIFIISFCSESAYGKAMTAAGALMLVAAVLIAVAVVLFGVKGHEERGFKLDGQVKLIWGMWLAVAGFALALVTAVFFFIQGPRTGERKASYKTYGYTYGIAPASHYQK